MDLYSNKDLYKKSNESKDNKSQKNKESKESKNIKIKKNFNHKNDSNEETDNKDYLNQQNIVFAKNSLPLQTNISVEEPINLTNYTSQIKESLKINSLLDTNQTADVVKSKREVKSKLLKDICPPALKERGYEINEEIGGGAFSHVYRARYKVLNDKNIAVKIISLDKVPEVWKEKCLKQELKIIRKLQHPHIIKVWDIIKTRRNVFIFMDLAENNSVLHHIRSQNKPASESTARLWFTQVTGAISYMHSKGIAHRDLKNENILLDRDFNAKITDFGFACFTYDKETRHGLMSPTCCGTIAYIAPEVINPPYEARIADIWSLGICLYEMVTLAKPFDETQNPKKLLKAQLNREWKFSSNLENKLSEEIKDLIRKMLEPDVEQRLTANQVLQHKWIIIGFGVKN